MAKKNRKPETFGCPKEFEGYQRLLNALFK